jgi:dTDP-glucose pyrophosphorylase
MSEWRSAIVHPSASIRDAMRHIERSELQIALVVDEDGILRGVATDGDIRRGLLDRLTLEDSIDRVMNTAPLVVGTGEDPQAVVDLMVDQDIHHVPVVDGDGRLVGLERIAEALRPRERPNPVMLMAGGLGTRLRPLTNTRPKPLIEVGDRPILQTILESFALQGFSDFYLFVNYKSDMIRRHFGDGSRWGVSIQYIEEVKRLGTAGPLGLLSSRPQHPMIVMNGDLLTTLNFARFLDYHTEQEVIATMGVREYNMQVPYGVIEVNGQRIANITEKPTERYFVNAGMYVLDPQALDYIPDDQFYDMPTLYEQLIAESHPVTAFPIQEYWRDIGRPEDLETAQREYETVFVS